MATATQIRSEMKELKEVNTEIKRLAISLKMLRDRKKGLEEDIIEYQVGYLRKVAYLINESKIYVEQLDEKGTFRSDDEVGVFFNFMKEIQETINDYRLPEDYGKAKK